MDAVTHREETSVSLMPWRHEEAAVLAITVAPEQLRFTNHQTVAEFLADDDDHPTFETFAICTGGAVVGMVTYGREEWQEPPQRWIPLIAIDVRFQGKGYGRAALRALFEGARSESPSVEVVGLSCSPENVGAYGLYLSLGFEPGTPNDRGGTDMWLQLGAG